MVAKTVGRFASEVEETITPRELFEWSVFFRMEHEANEKSRREAESKARSRRR